MALPSFLNRKTKDWGLRTKNKEDKEDKKAIFTLPCLLHLPHLASLPNPQSPIPNPQSLFPNRQFPITP